MKPIVLMYHDVFVNNSNESGFNTLGALHYKIKSEKFESHLKTISQYCLSKGIDKNKIIFTFDDGGISFYSVIAPILEKYGWRACFFISTSYIGTEGFLDEQHIKDLRLRGHMIGSHSNHHKILTKLSVEEVIEELRTSVSTLSTILNEHVTLISIPNGCYNQKILDIALENGFNTIFTSQPTTRIKQLSNAKVIGRYAIVHNTKEKDIIRLLSSPLFRYIVELKYLILQFLKIVFGSNYFKVKLILRRYLFR